RRDDAFTLEEKARHCCIWEHRAARDFLLFPRWDPRTELEWGGKPMAPDRIREQLHTTHGAVSLGAAQRELCVLLWALHGTHRRGQSSRRRKEASHRNRRGQW